MNDKSVDYLIVDTTAFIQNASLHEVAENIVTCQEVVAEITNKRQLRRLVVLPYDLIIKDVHPEYIKVITDFAKKTGDYPSLSATDIKVMALTYQMHIEKEGSQNLRTEPLYQKPVITTENKEIGLRPDVTGFFLPSNDDEDSKSPDVIDEMNTKMANLDPDETEQTGEESDDLKSEETEDDFNSDETEDDSGWITPSNVQVAKKKVNSELMEQKHVPVACMTTDFAMQNVLRQINLNVAALDGRMIKQLRTYILRCYSCFKLTSIMTKKFCPKCGNNTLKKVAASLDENGEMQIHINPKRPLTARGKKFSLPRIKGGKHPNNPILVGDQPMPDNKQSRLARMKNNPLDDDYIAGYSPFLMRDITSKSAQLGIRSGQELKHWMMKNPNEVRRKRK